MRQHPSFVLTDTTEIRRLIDANPWVMLVSHTDGSLVASHYAVLLDEDRDDLTTVGFRRTPTKVVGKQKLSQYRPRDVVEEIIAEPQNDAGAYPDPRLADEMQRDPDKRKAAQ
ncbi:FMN-binding negative transcriptional regulator (plasmid) [Coraliomargarita sp. W4R53]